MAIHKHFWVLSTHKTKTLIRSTLLISSNSLFCSNSLISNTPLISSTRDKLCANPLQFFFFSPKWPILQLKPTLLLVMPLLSVLNKNNNKEVSNKNRQDTGETHHEVKTPTIQTILATNRILAHDGTTLTTRHSAFSARSSVTLSKSAGNESEKTSPASTWMDIPFGLEETLTTGRQFKIEDQTHPEMVNSVHTAKS